MHGKPGTGSEYPTREGIRQTGPGARVAELVQYYRPPPVDAFWFRGR